jgi:enoyl-CoA hydratase/carnithine racemase
VRTITFNRPEVHNAQNPEMLEMLIDALAATARLTPDRCRVVVLEGAGKSFCSGHDLRAVIDDSQYAANAATPEGRYRQEMELFVQPLYMFRDLPMPTICKVQGHCIAAGLMFCASADFVAASDHARFRSPVMVTQGVNDAEVPALAWRIGERRAKQLLWLDEEMSASEARNAGLVNWVVPEALLDDKVGSVAERIVLMPPGVLSLSKATFAFMADRMGRTDVDRYHFLSHQFSHQTAEARAKLERRLQSGSAQSGASVDQRAAETA